MLFRSLMVRSLWAVSARWLMKDAIVRNTAPRVLSARYRCVTFFVGGDTDRPDTAVGGLRHPVAAAVDRWRRPQNGTLSRQDRHDPQP